MAAELERLATATATATASVAGESAVQSQTAVEVAERFAPVSRRGVSGGLVITGGAAMVVAVVIQVAAFVILHEDLRAGPFPLFAVSLPVFGVSIVASVLIDYRLPRRLRRRRFSTPPQRNER